MRTALLLVVFLLLGNVSAHAGHGVEPVDVLLPGGHEGFGPKTTSIWRLTARITPAFGPESRIVIEGTLAGDVTGDATLVLGDSIHEKLDRMDPRWETLPPERLRLLMEKVRVAKVSANGSTCAALRGLAKELLTMSLPVVAEPRAIVDGTGYEVWLESGMDSVYWQISDTARERRPLASWIERARALLVGECRYTEAVNPTTECQ